MEYVERINSILRTASTQDSLVLDLFAGCGGLSLGFEAQGFYTQGFEMNSDYCNTYEKNLKGTCIQTVLSFETELPYAPVVIGGPPCQPFSVNGEQKGLHDSRNCLPIFIASIAKIKPQIFIFENVRGLMYRNKWYLDEVIHSLAELGYIVEAKLLNAVDYGIPQKRERLIVVGHKGGFSFPPRVACQVMASQAIGDSATLTSPEAKYLTPSMDEYVARYEKASACKRPRDLHLDQPSRTLTCRNLAGATGDMMRIKLGDGRRRRLFVREAARLQSFPDWFTFYGTETSQFNQIGNAVPPLLAYHLAASVRQYLENDAALDTNAQAIQYPPYQLSLPFDR